MYNANIRTFIFRYVNFVSLHLCTLIVKAAYEISVMKRYAFVLLRKLFPESLSTVYYNHKYSDCNYIHRYIHTYVHTYIHTHICMPLHLYEKEPTSIERY